VAAGPKNLLSDGSNADAAAREKAAAASVSDRSGELSGGAGYLVYDLLHCLMTS
jgi:hypothetical protein